MYDLLIKAALQTIDSFARREPRQWARHPDAAAGAPGLVLIPSCIPTTESWTITPMCT
jgi:hypothetical protein